MNPTTELATTYDPALVEPEILARWEEAGAFHAEPGSPGSPGSPGTDEPPHGYRAVRREVDRRVLQQALQDHGQNISQAARALGISRTTFYNKARKLGIELPRRRGGAWER